MVTSETSAESGVLIVEWASDHPPRFIVGYEVEYRALGGNENGTRFVNGSTTKLVLTGLSQDIDYEVLSHVVSYSLLLNFCLMHTGGLHQAGLRVCRPYIRCKLHLSSEHISCNYRIMLRKLIMMGSVKEMPIYIIIPP